jgi:hypothetical protein
MKLVPSMSKTSGRYHGIYLRTELCSGGTHLRHDTTGIAVDRATSFGVAGGGNQMHRSYGYLVKSL